jgi:hypothetical protein
MFECLVNLYAFNFDTHNHSLRLVSRTPHSLEPIGVILNSEHRQISDALTEIMSDHLICCMSSLKPRLFDIELVNNIVNINFVTSTPIDLKVVDSYYMNIDNRMLSINKTVQKALMYV